MESRKPGNMPFPSATPMQPVPGAFFNTPAMPRSQKPPTDPVRRRLFNDSEAGVVGGTAAPGAGIMGDAVAVSLPGPRPSRSRSSTGSGWQVQQTQQTQQVQQSQQTKQKQQAQQAQQGREQKLDPIAKAARCVNNFLRIDDAFPEIDMYCRQGASSDYDLSHLDSAWTPFQKTHMYPIPNQVFDHYNAGRLQTLMGLFAEINHAWVAIDNSLFLWDYTNPDPELIGYEQQPNTIHAVALVTPKPGVFVASITHVLVVATTDNMIVLGMSAQRDAGGVMRVSLYDTKMSTGIRGQDVRIITGSADGRIYFGGSGDIDLCELYYHKEEGFFFSRCGKYNHTNPRWISAVVAPLNPFASRGHEYLVDIVVDNTRSLIYTLSSTSTIRTYSVESARSLVEVIVKDRNNILRDTSHMIHPSPLLGERTHIVSISPVAANESSRIHLMALTNTGCRLFFSATSIASYMSTAAAIGAPQSMQVQFIKFPPPTRPGGNPNPNDGATDVTSQALNQSRSGKRFPPGFFLDFVSRTNQPNVDLLFVSAPETGRIRNTPSAVPVKYHEHASWIELGSKAEAVGLITKPFAATKQPLGFGNELAVQFDDPPSEFAVLTNTGVHVVRRRRLVDIFAAVIRSTVGVENLEAEARRFTQLYGRVETVSTALAVACGHGTDARPGGPRASDQAAEDRARQVFVDFGGHPTIRERDGAALTTESVKLSSRHDGLVTYVGRLLRMLWKAKVVTVSVNPAGVVVVGSTVPTAKLQSVQESLQRLRRFLDANRGLIQGLSGPADLQTAGNRQDEVAMQAEHQALHAMERLMEGISEGISFVLMLFEERVTDIYMRLDDQAKKQFCDLTYDSLFAQSSGKEIARVLVRAIVNRNIETGANVETVADALRRRCGSFCSPDDVVVFKAQEQLQRATEQEASSNATRTLLLESLRLFERVAGSLTYANLRAAVAQYITLRYWAGAIQLCLVCAHERDRGNAASAWMHDGRPGGDPRAGIFQERRRCYDLIHEVLANLDQVGGQEPETTDGRLTLMGNKRLEAYDVVNRSADEVFHFGLYEWYIEQGWTDRILTIESPHVITFLQQLTAAGPEHAELLCRFYTNRSRFYDAGCVQHDLANSDFDIGIKERITLLSRAKANAGVTTMGVNRQQQQQLTHQVSELLEVAHIQEDLLERLMVDDRVNPERRQEIERELNGRIRDLSDLFNNYADQANYFDLSLFIFHSAEYRHATTVAGTWSSLIQAAHNEAVALNEDDRDTPLPYEHVSSRVQAIAHRTSLSSFVFPIATLLPELCQYSVAEMQDGRVGADPSWPVRLFLALGVSYDMVAHVLEGLLDTQDWSGAGVGRARVVEWTLCVIEAWVGEMKRRGGVGVFGRTGVGSSIGPGSSGGAGGQQQQQQTAAAAAAGGMGQWVVELLQRCEGALPPATGAGSNANMGGMDVAELRRLTRSLRREVATLVERGSMGGIGMGSMRFV